MSLFLAWRITIPRSVVYGVQDGAGVRLDSTPAMFVDGVRPGAPTEPCMSRAQFWFSGDTRVLRNGALADTSELRVGRRVAVWSQGIVLESCPPQASAVVVMIEQSSISGSDLTALGADGRAKEAAAGPPLHWYGKAAAAPPPQII